MMRWLLAALFLLSGCGARDDLLLSGASGGESPGVTVSSLALGWNHSCALLSDGAATCWGQNGNGQIGSGTAGGNQPTPARMASPTDIAALAGGLDQACAVLRDGTLECWGNDTLGAVGAGSKGTNVPPTAIGSGFTGVSAGFDYACAVRAGGGAACWGYGDKGQLGNGAASSQVQAMPAPVVGLSQAVAIGTSQYLTCALNADGSVACWGLGPLGDGSTGDSATPVTVMGLAGKAKQIAVGSMHACALREDGTVMCWGYGGYGELGLGTDTVTAPLPVAVPGVSPARSISAGTYHSCAALADGTVQCWGNDTAGMMGTFVPAPVPGLSGAVAVAAGEAHDCALLASGRVVCWGDNGAGQLGDGTTTASATPVEVIGVP